ncbi:Ig-like domain-containing protein, partial [Streptomyces sp. AS02]|uniref:Ig-like domain-containing protein n=1 Tax=Streptomyces sp. AS02 TaxID=2938946 RepID=UPI002021202C
KNFTVNGTTYQPGETATITGVGTITITPEGVLTFTPETDYAGPVPSVDYTVTDGQGGEDTGTVTFTDVPNAPPVAVDDSVTTQSGTPVTQDIIGNDTDANDDPLTVKNFTV